MSITYTWTFNAIRVCDCAETGLTDVVKAFEVRVRADDGETEGHSDWYAEAQLATPDPSAFVTFPADPADTPAFEAQLKAWALEHLGMTESALEAAALAQLEARKVLPMLKALP